MTSGAESLSIPIGSGTFPDPAFLSWVQQNDTDVDGFLSQTEREAVTQMDLRKQGIQDLSGLEWFDRLEKLIAVKMICSPWSWRISRIDIADLQRKSQAVKSDAERRARAGAAFLLSLQSLSAFVWALTAGAAAYAISHLWRYLQGRKTGQASEGDLFLTILPMAFAVFAISWLGQSLLPAPGTGYPSHGRRGGKSSSGYRRHPLQAPHPYSPSSFLPHPNHSGGHAGGQPLPCSSRWMNAAGEKYPATIWNWVWTLGMTTIPCSSAIRI